MELVKQDYEENVKQYQVLEKKLKESIRRKKSKTLREFLD